MTGHALHLDSSRRVPSVTLCAAGRRRLLSASSSAAVPSSIDVPAPGWLPPAVWRSCLPPSPAHSIRTIRWSHWTWIAGKPDVHADRSRPERFNAPAGDTFAFACKEPSMLHRPALSTSSPTPNADWPRPHRYPPGPLPSAIEHHRRCS